ncbi:hypothetical protein CUMW_148940 [Citrus unshiu]|nr:hypothetical protein CUMW_148930 [Citrus unshiu]GAY53394.1 hypothetical protein CUMW_148940 [Citrus unshiu]
MTPNFQEASPAKSQACYLRISLDMGISSQFVPHQRKDLLLYNMDPRCTGEMFKHLEKQNELLTEIHRSMSHELHKLQVEEEMLMRKFYELMTAHGLTKKNEGSANASDDGEAGNSASLLCLPSNDQQ